MIGQQKFLFFPTKRPKLVGKGSTRTRGHFQHLIRTETKLRTVPKSYGNIFTQEKHVGAVASMQGIKISKLGRFLRKYPWMGIIGIEGKRIGQGAVMSFCINLMNDLIGRELVWSWFWRGLKVDLHFGHRKTCERKEWDGLTTFRKKRTGAMSFGRRFLCDARSKSYFCAAEIVYGGAIFTVLAPLPNRKAIGEKNKPRAVRTFSRS